ncbi:MAG TPA: iron ABC transporter permease [Pyrinomonadaceae bacterium]|nr:iron ABC transporter permease [Pyrinomonadaceae bacterium]
MAILPTPRSTVIGGAFILFIGLCVVPVIYMFIVSLITADSTLTFDNYRRLLVESRQRDLLLNSTLLGACSALLATLLGSPLGLLLARARLPAKQVLRIALIIPLIIPPYVLALAWILFTSSTGLLARIIGRDLFSGWTYSFAGAVVVLSLAYYPLSMLATEAASRRVDGHLEEGALLVTNTRRVLWRITVPLITPIVAAAALTTFVLGLSEFGVPSLMRVRVYTTEVFTAFAALYDFGTATALAVPLLAVTFIVAVTIKLIIGERFISDRRSVYPALPVTLDRYRIFVFAGTILVLTASVVLPLMTLAYEAGNFQRFTSTLEGSGAAIINSLSLAAIAATLIIVLATFLGYWRGRTKRRWRGLFDLVLLVIFAVPSTVLGVGLIGLWNRPGLFGKIYTSQVIIIIAYIARFVTVAALILAASVRQIPESLEEAAEVAGGSWPRTFAQIVIPNIVPGVAAAWLVSFILAVGELGTTILVAPAGESTLPVRIYTLIANTPSSEVAALALMEVGIVLIPLAMLAILTRSGLERRGERGG